MTIVNSVRRLSYYPHLAISQEVVTVLTEAWGAANDEASGLIKAFECYCSITDARITSLEHDSAELNAAVRGFLGALTDDDFCDMDDVPRAARARSFVRMINHVAENHPNVRGLDWRVTLRAECKADWLNKKCSLNLSRVNYWKGWTVTSRKKATHYLKLSGLWQSHGEVFTAKFYHEAKLYCAKHARPETSFINIISDYIASNATTFTVETFQSASGVTLFSQLFMKDFYIKRITDGADMDDVRHQWTSIAVLLTRMFIDSRTWAKPDFPIPRQGRKRKHTDKIKLKTSDDGVEVKFKLMTEIPVHITDSEAIEILFNKINRDIKTVKDWAIEQSNQLWELRQRRLARAKYGTPITGGCDYKVHDEINFDDICATFQQNGFRRGDKYLKSHFGMQRRETGKELGLPLAGSLYPFQFLLVMEHSEITESFLHDFRLYDNSGKRSGLVRTNTGYQLVGYKSRRGNDLSEQKIQLSENSATLIKKIIAITAPLRAYLKAKGDESWRELFLTCGLGFAEPLSALFPSWNAKTFENDFFRARLTEQFHPHTLLRGDELTNFLSNVSLTSCRASCAVSIYIETQDVDKMRRSLGHFSYDNFLLGHYLPSCILQFFQTRWIRIFQKGLLYLAMQNSPHLLKVLRFKTIDELHTFLSNHALKDIPKSLSDPDMEDSELKNNGEVHFCISPGILATLLSLSQAVAQSIPGKAITGLAKYWVKVTELIVKNINIGKDHVLMSHLRKGYENINTKGMEALIYEKA